MIAEFAVEPASMVTSLDRFIGMIDRFGIDQGRIISDFAQDRWSRAVIEAAETARLGEIAQQSIVERLREKRDEMAIARLRTYPRIDGGWIANVLAEDARSPWACIVTDTSNGHPREVSACNLHSGRAPFKVECHATVPRTTKAIASIAEPLIRMSKVLHLVDKHITIDGTQKRRVQWVDPIAALIGCGSQRLQRVFIHTLSDITDPKKADRTAFERNFRQAFAGKLPQGPRITIQRWIHRAGGQELHDRFVLTDIGGLEYGQGLDAGPDGTKVRVRLLPRAAWSEELSNFDPATSPYDAEDPIIFQAGTAN